MGLFDAVAAVATGGASLGLKAASKALPKKSVVGAALGSVAKSVHAAEAPLRAATMVPLKATTSVAVALGAKGTVSRLNRQAGKEVKGELREMGEQGQIALQAAPALAKGGFPAFISAAAAGQFQRYTAPALAAAMTKTPRGVASLVATEQLAAVEQRTPQSAVLPGAAMRPVTFGGWLRSLFGLRPRVG